MRSKQRIETFTKHLEELRPRAVDVGSTGVMYEFLLADLSATWLELNRTTCFSRVEARIPIPKIRRPGLDVK